MCRSGHYVAVQFVEKHNNDQSQKEHVSREFIYKMILNREFKGNQECENITNQENGRRNSWHGGTAGMRESPNTAGRLALIGRGSTP